MLQRFRAFLELEFRFIANNTEADAYKAELLDFLTSKADDMIKSGEKDEDKIYASCVNQLGEFRDTLEGFKKTVNPKYQAKRALTFILFGIVFTLIVVALYLALSFTSVMPWSQSWIILTSGYLGAAVVLSVYIFVVLLSKKKFNLARPFIHLAIVLSTVILYLCYSVLTANVWRTSWLIFLVMVILSTGIECIFNFLTDSKLDNLSLMIFVPTSFTIVYVMLSLAKMLTWHPYWFIPLIAVVFDILFAFNLLRKKLS